MRHVREKFRFVPARDLKGFGFLPDLFLRKFKFSVLLADVVALQFQNLGAFFKFLIDDPQLFLLMLQAFLRHAQGLCLLLKFLVNLPELFLLVGHFISLLLGFLKQLLYPLP